MSFWSTIGNIGKAIVTGGWSLIPKVGDAVSKGVGKVITAIGGEPIANVLGFGADLAGSALQYKAQADVNEISIREADKNRAWQEFMANTAHQREVDDLRKAGLNPILAINKGAAVGSPVMPQVVSPMSRVSSALAIMKLKREMDLTKSLNLTEKTKQEVNRATERLINENRVVAESNAKSAANDAKVEEKAGGILSWLRKVGSAFTAKGMKIPISIQGINK